MNNLNLVGLSDGLVVAPNGGLGELDLGGGDLDSGVEDVPHTQKRALQKLVAKAVG